MFHQLCLSWNSTRRHPRWLQSITSIFSATELEVRGAVYLERLEEQAPRAHAGGLPGSSLSHFMSTQACQSVVQTLHRVVSVPCKRFAWAKISATCHSHTHCYQLQRGWTGSVRGQSQLELVVLGFGADQCRLNRLCQVKKKIWKDA